MAVVMYSSSYCPYCVRAKALLRKKNITIQDINVDGRRDLRAEMAARSGRSSVPQIWIGEQHIGGCDDLYALEKAGTLDALLAADQ